MEGDHFPSQASFDQIPPSNTGPQQSVTTGSTAQLWSSTEGIDNASQPLWEHQSEPHILNPKLFSDPDLQYPLLHSSAMSSHLVGSPFPPTCNTVTTHVPNTCCLGQSGHSRSAAATEAGPKLSLAKQTPRKPCKSPMGQCLCQAGGTLVPKLVAQLGSSSPL